MHDRQAQDHSEGGGERGGVAMDMFIILTEYTYVKANQVMPNKHLHLTVHRYR